MKHEPNPSDELTRLFARFCDGCISDEEMDRLNTLMEEDAEARHLYRRWVDLEMELWLTTTPENIEAAPVAEESSDRVVPFPSRWVRWAAAAAVIVIGFLVFNQSPRINPPSNGDAPVVAQPKLESPKVLAQIVEMDSAQWNESDRIHDTDLEEGRHELLAGTAKVRFAGGTTISLQGPAMFEVRGTNSFQLTRGMATVFVPSWNADFRMATPRVRLVEPGTECGLSVGEDGVTTVGVFRGEALARVDSEYLGMTQDLRLTREEGIEIDSVGAVTSAIIGNNHRFAGLRQTPGREVPMIANASFEFPRVRRAERMAASGWTLLAHPIANVDKMPVDAGVVNRELSVTRAPSAPAGRQWAYLNAATFADGRSTFTTMHQAVGDVQAATTYRLSFTVGMPERQRGMGGFEAGLYAGSAEEGPLSAMRQWKNPVRLRPGESQRIELEYHCPRSTPYRTDQLFIVFGAVPSAQTGVHKVLIDQVDLQIVDRKKTQL